MLLRNVYACPGQTFVVRLDGKDTCGFLKLTGLRVVETQSMSLPVKLLITDVKCKSGEMFIDVPPNSLAGTRCFCRTKVSSASMFCWSSRRRIGWSATTCT